MTCRFEQLIQNVDDDSFYMCLLDDLDYVGLNKTLDPRLLDWLAAQSTSQRASEGQLPAAMDDTLYAAFKQGLPPYTGMPHPPPCNHSECQGKPWSAPFLPEYDGPLHANTSSGSLNLTMCNYYLPAHKEAAGIHR